MPESRQGRGEQGGGAKIKGGFLEKGLAQLGWEELGLVERQKRPDSLSRNKATEWVALQTLGYRIKMTWKLWVWKQLSVSPEHGKAGGPLAGDI